MATITVLQSNSFEEWRVKTNQISQTVGDLSLLNTDIAAASLVESINNAADNVIVLAIALG